MKICVHHTIVRQNIELFKKLVGRYSAGGEQYAKSPLQERIYTAFVNRVTGKIYFPELEGDEAASKDSFLDSNQWKAIEIRIKKYEGEDGVFEVAEEDTNWRCFRCDDLDHLAYEILSETIKTLNFVSKKIQAHPEMANVARELAGLEVEIFTDVSGGKDIVHEAWHQVDRVGAEKLLKGQIEGTFLFRKDPYVLVLEKQLKENFDPSIKCMTLTYLEESGKVIDKTIICTNGRWLIYDDDPNLEGPSYANPLQLIDAMQDTLKMPFLN